MPLTLPALAPGRRFTLPRPHGSSDALFLARQAAACREERRRLVVFTADPADAQEGPGIGRDVDPLVRKPRIDRSTGKIRW